jgi:hypothetical protein
MAPGGTPKRSAEHAAVRQPTNGNAKILTPDRAEPRTGRVASAASDRRAGTAVELAAHEMVPPAIGTDLDEITGELVVGAAELLELGGV